MNEEAIWEWAWKLYNKSFHELPDCDHVQNWRAYQKACRDIQMVMLRAESRERLQKRQEGMVMTATKTNKRAPVKIQTVVAASEMDTATFAKHFEARHSDSLAQNQTALHTGMTFESEQLYRSFHMRLHATKRRAELGHDHEPDKPDVAIDFAIECLAENHNWGWKELAGIEGHVAVFPDGDIATRVKGKVAHHKTIESATDRLLEANGILVDDGDEDDD